MNKVKGLWYSYNRETNQRRCVPFISQNTRLDIYEGNIPPLLRYFHINNVSPSGWVFINLLNAETPNNRVSSCKYEFICGVKDLIPQPNKETIVPYKICSFDIEASSSHGDFPVPKKVINDWLRWWILSKTVFGGHENLPAAVGDDDENDNLGVRVRKLRRDRFGLSQTYRQNQR
jgi:hypothetical protein